MAGPSAPPPSEADDLDYEVIVVRYDNEHGRVVVDLGSVETMAAATMLRMAADAVYESLDSALVGSDDDPVDEEED